MTKPVTALAEHKDAHAERILVVDYGGQYTQLIARRVREVGVYSEILPWDASPEAIAEFAPKGIILSGGPESVHEVGSPQISDALLSAGAPVLGICYGMQALAAKLGGVVAPSDHREYGYAEVDLTGSDPLLAKLGARLKVWMSHGDRVERLPKGFAPTAKSSNSPFAAMADVERKIYALQFHPEVTHTQHGLEIIRRFVLDICGCAPVWTAKNIVAEHIAAIRAKVGRDRVLLGLSGGVDSSVVAALLHEAIGDQLVCVFVDTGLLRLNEGDQVMAVFAKHLGANVIRVDAEKTFLAALAGVDDPEQKRKIIGRLFVEIFEEEAAKLSNVKWLAQGTIYPDV
ncbi:MAG TPA: glutamine-hydrolyzing GMP synthase, partial [Gammaproteobacteria bacterium]|nr:glutamine-hydrolyzing GMP synthase [Gammaproteobacteria bacterium]